MRLSLRKAGSVILKAACVSWASISLTACAHRPREPAPPIKLPVAVTCVANVAPAPTYAADTVDLTSDIFELVQALLIDREQRKAREVELEAARAGCS